MGTMRSNNSGLRIEKISLIFVFFLPVACQDPAPTQELQKAQDAEATAINAKQYARTSFNAAEALLAQAKSKMDEHVYAQARELAIKAQAAFESADAEGKRIKEEIRPKLEELIQRVGQKLVLRKSELSRKIKKTRTMEMKARLLEKQLALGKIDEKFKSAQFDFSHGDYASSSELLQQVENALDVVKY